MGGFVCTAWKRLVSQKVAHMCCKRDGLMRGYNGAMLPKCKGKKYYGPLILPGIESMTSPVKINPAPSIEAPVSRSARRTTPNAAAVNGSARPKVTDVATGTASSPRAKRVYAAAVATRPRCSATAMPRPWASQARSPKTSKGLSNTAARQNSTAMTASGGRSSRSPLR